jgi:rod shape-determining protein MreC
MMKLARLADYKRTIVLAALLLLSSLIYVLNASQWGIVQRVRRATLDVYGPLLQASDWLRRQAVKPFATIFAYDELKHENEVLKVQLAQLRARYDGLEEAHQTLRRLARWEFGDLSDGAEAKESSQHYVAARVIGLHFGNMAHTAMLDKGSRDGVIVDAPVVAPEGLVGIVRQAGAHSSTVQIISDPNSSIAVAIEDAREKGLLKGLGKSDALEVLLESPSKRVDPGQRVKTAGVRGSFYPAGLLVGSVREVQRDKFGNKIAAVEPAADLSRLDAVLILCDKVISRVDSSALDIPVGKAKGQPVKTSVRASQSE